MGMKSPGLNHNQKQEYIGRHLYNELRWLLGAATEWSVQDQLRLEIVGYDVQVYAMDSALLHARTLLEFFTRPTRRNHYSFSDFVDTELLKSDSYANWEDPVHSSLMLAQDRSGPAPLESVGGEKELNEMPVEFAREILRLWKEFEERLGKSSDPGDQELQELARKKRREAIEGARCVVSSTDPEQRAAERFQVLEPVFVFVH